MEVLPKDMITRWILPHLPARTGGRRLAVDPAEVVESIKKCGAVGLSGHR